MRLSPTSLNLFLDCPRCFWLQVNRKVKRPGPPVASITNGIDRVVKEYFDQYRLKDTLPPILEGKLSGRLMINLPKKGWFDFMDDKISAKLGGYLDDCLQLDQTHFAPLDHKTRGSAPNSIHRAYQLQMDVYTLLLEKNNLATFGKAYIVYYIPKKIATSGDFEFEALVKEITTDPARASEVFYNAAALLRGPIPAINLECGFCKWTETVGIS